MKSPLPKPPPPKPQLPKSSLPKPPTPNQPLSGKPKSLFFVFVCNLPKHTTHQWLEDFFNTVGTLSGVDIPSKPNKNGRFFAFIHYRSKEDVSLAIKEFNGIFVCGTRLFVTVSRYSSFSTSPVSKSPTHTPSHNNTPKSFKEALTGSALPVTAHLPSSALVCNVAPPTESCPGHINHLVSKYKYSVLGVAHSNWSAEYILGEIIREGVLDVDVSLGNRVFIISSSNQPFFAELEASNWDWLRRWFVAFLNKPNLFELGGFFRWVAISGVPILAWSEESFTSIASKFGEILLVHPESISGGAFDRALILVHSSSVPPANLSIELQVLDRSFTILASVTSSSTVPVTTMPQLYESSLPDSPRLASISTSSELKCSRSAIGDSLKKSYSGASLEDGEFFPSSPLRSPAPTCDDESVNSEVASPRGVASASPSVASDSAVRVSNGVPKASEFCALVGESAASKTGASVDEVKLVSQVKYGEKECPTSIVGVGPGLVSCSAIGLVMDSGPPVGSVTDELNVPLMKLFGKSKIKSKRRRRWRSSEPLVYRRRRIRKKLKSSRRLRSFQVPSVGPSIDEAPPFLGSTTPPISQSDTIGHQPVPQDPLPAETLLVSNDPTLESIIPNLQDFSDNRARVVRILDICKSLGITWNIPDAHMLSALEEVESKNRLREPV